MPAPGIYTTARAITPGVPASSGTGIVIACSAPGIVRLVMFDKTFLDVYVTIGTAEFTGYAVSGVDAAGTTATATVSVVA